MGDLREIQVLERGSLCVCDVPSVSALPHSRRQALAVDIGTQDGGRVASSSGARKGIAMRLCYSISVGSSLPDAA